MSLGSQMFPMALGPSWYFAVRGKTKLVPKLCWKAYIFNASDFQGCNFIDNVATRHRHWIFAKQSRKTELFSLFFVDVLALEATRKLYENQSQKVSLCHNCNWDNFGWVSKHCVKTRKKLNWIFAVSEKFLQRTQVGIVCKRRF